MTKTQFLLELREHLKGLPQEEIDNCLSYYEEYFADAGPEQEQQVIDHLGTPAQVAAQVRADWAVKSLESQPSSPRRGFNVLWTVLLAILAAPIALPLAIAAASIALALIIVLGSIILALGAVVIALGASGIAITVLGVVLFFTHLPTGLFTIGSGLTLLGLCGLLSIVIAKLAQWIFRGLLKMMNAMRRKHA
jgi:uncharacterized membrane protein